MSPSRPEPSGSAACCERLHGLALGQRGERLRMRRIHIPWGELADAPLVDEQDLHPASPPRRARQGEHALGINVAAGDDRDDPRPGGQLHAAASTRPSPRHPRPQRTFGGNEQRAHRLADLQLVTSTTSSSTSTRDLERVAPTNGGVRPSASSPRDGGGHRLAGGERTGA